MGRDKAHVPIRPDVDGDDSTVRAGGGIVLRRQGGREWEVLLVHRPRRDDWSLPKGKLEPNESWEAGALREVEEETGYRCSLGKFVGYTGYTDRRGRPKVVAYWVMEVIDGSFAPNQEVDELRWVELGRTRDVLSYPRDRDLVESLEELDEPVLARSG